MFSVPVIWIGLWITGVVISLATGDHYINELWEWAHAAQTFLTLIFLVSFLFCVVAPGGIDNDGNVDIHLGTFLCFCAAFMFCAGTALAIASL